MHLPVDDVLAEIRATLSARTGLVLQAPPGAGKTTRVPLALLSAEWLDGRKIVMLEPRRLAARMAAGFMARQLKEDVGQTVGYRIRFDTKVSRATRIEVVTEGVLTRLLRNDVALEDYGVVIFDEFHERSLHADLGLALTLQARALLRPELRIVAMSATLDGERVAQLIDAPVITSSGRVFPVETVYLPVARDTRIETAVTRAVLYALREHQGDILVFLPGAGEIQRTQQNITLQLDSDTYVVPLFGNLSQAEQDRAIAPAAHGKRKIVLSTATAETSLTIEGVRIVVDSGLMRVPRFDARTGMTRLVTTRVTRASADQRRGRAGRVASGVCYRLWAEHEDAALVPHGRPEILDADLASLALDLAAWGIRDPAELAWLDAPPASAFGQAREILRELDALDASHLITPHGKRMADLPVHPRLAHMLLRARDLASNTKLPTDAKHTLHTTSATAFVDLACDIAALVGERDILRGDRWTDSDIRLRLDMLHHRANAGVHADRGVVDRVTREAAQFRRLLRSSGDRAQATSAQRDPDRIQAQSTAVRDHSTAGLLLAFAYPDRIGRARGERGKFVLRNGRGAHMERGHALAGEEFIVAAQLEGSGRDSRVFLAGALTENELRDHFADQIQETATLELTAGGIVQRVVREQLGAIVLKEVASTDVTVEEAARALLNDVAMNGVDTLPWSKSARQLQQRLVFMHAHDAQWPDASADALQQRLEEWLLPQLHGARSRADLAKLDVHGALTASLDWQQRAALDRLAPTHLVVPTGSRIVIDYSDPRAPFAAVRLQEVFGMRETPRIANGRVPLTLHLLSPAQRPVQVTRDLESFWKSGYFEVKKELKGRYPKHHWPDDPLTAEPTRGAKRRRAADPADPAGPADPADPRQL